MLCSQLFKKKKTSIYLIKTPRTIKNLVFYLKIFLLNFKIQQEIKQYSKAINKS